MKRTRFWPIAAAMLSVALAYTGPTHADSKSSPKTTPLTGESVSCEEKAVWAPSDLPQLECVETAVWQIKAGCSTGECLPCAAAATCAANDCARTAGDDCKVECVCGKSCACDHASTMAIGQPAKSELCRAGAAPYRIAACEGAPCDGADDCPCGAARVATFEPSWSHVVRPGAVAFDEPRPWRPMLQAWSPPGPPLPPHPEFGPMAPPFAPPPPLEWRHGVHEELVGAMQENARLAAREAAWSERDTAWRELQARNEKIMHLAVENARLQMQVEFASQKEALHESLVEAAVKNATLEAKLEAVEERQHLVEALMEVAAEKAKLEAMTEMLEARNEIHAQALEALVEARQELFAPLHEALVENAALKAQAAAHAETTALKNRIADLERALDKTARQEEKSAAPALETAKKPQGNADTK